MAAENEGSFLELLEVHKTLYAEFLGHQDALLDRDFPEARARLERFVARLERHITAEEELLFDAFFLRTDQVGSTPLDLFTGEHKHFRQLLAGYLAVTRHLDAADPQVRRRVVELIDDESLFKSIFLHHDERERNLLYPALDRSAEPGKRGPLLRRFHEGK